MLVSEAKSGPIWGIPEKGRVGRIFVTRCTVGEFQGQTGHVLRWGDKAEKFK
jgi:hypothetical protein